jgi:hypothetical protein
MFCQLCGPNWVLFEASEEHNERKQELLECAQRVWPVALSSGRRQINTETSIYEKDRLIVEAWEYVLSAISRARKKGHLHAGDRFDFDAYLMRSFQYRLGRLMKRERMHQRLFMPVDQDTLEMLTPVQRNAETDLFRRLQVQEVVSRMDNWTREVWNYLLGGVSWEWIANRYGMNTSQAKMRYRYYLEKIRMSLDGGKNRRPGSMHRRKGVASDRHSRNVDSFGMEGVPCEASRVSA